MERQRAAVCSWALAALCVIVSGQAVAPSLDEPRADGAAAALFSAGFPTTITQFQCPPGWWLIVRKCEDINECSGQQQPCPGLHTVCRNTPGSYRCQCRRGHIGDPYSFAGCLPDTGICAEPTTPTRRVDTTTKPTTTDDPAGNPTTEPTLTESTTTGPTLTEPPTTTPTVTGPQTAEPTTTEPTTTQPTTTEPTTTQPTTTEPTTTQPTTTEPTTTEPTTTEPTTTEPTTTEPTTTEPTTTEPTTTEPITTGSTTAPTTPMNDPTTIPTTDRTLIIVTSEATTQGTTTESTKPTKPTGAAGDVTTGDTDLPFPSSFITTVKVQTTTRPAIPPGYSRCLSAGINTGSFLRLVTQPTLPWAEAAVVCRAHHPDSRLVKITDASLNRCMQTWLQFQRNTYHAWIGLRLVGGEFRWPDGTTAAGLFEAWGRNQPLQQATQQCVRIYSFNGFWETADCDSELAFFCEIPA
ncbi:flocculation protein FLO11-like [Pollicipes pollicipes]|uniref:flocculation protein FLO11-like n=1 Tax=Pollicipes pollicipes TaxID=41117 RepID=UPI001884D4D4|nr:flocculation protein FLO11-like [Pollicipes pollicipes]